MALSDGFFYDTEQFGQNKTKFILYALNISNENLLFQRYLPKMVCKLTETKKYEILQTQ